MSCRLTLLVALALLAPLTHARAAVRVIAGPTPIPGGNARGGGDLTVANEHLAFALAVESPVPYGVPRGALIDLAPVTHGVIGRDRVVFADFIPNNWSAWPNTYQHVEVLERGPERARIRSVRDFGAVRLETLYTLRAGSDQIELRTTMTNEGAAALPDLRSGLTLWPSSGYLFPVPGLAGITDGDARAALARRVSAYDADWTVTLHAPYLDHVGSGSRDLFQRHTLAAGASRTFTGSLQVGSRGDLAPVVAADIAAQHLSSGSVQGQVSGTDGKVLAQPVVVVEKDGAAYAWVLGAQGRYRMRLPAGEYQLYATAEGYSRSKAVGLKVTAGSAAMRSFSDIAAPGGISFAVSDARNARALDARVSIAAGYQPLVQFLGHRTFFTELDAPGQLSLRIAPGHYVFDVSAGGGVLAASVPVRAEVRSGADLPERVGIEVLFDPRAEHWYAADLHHHADQAEAVTPPPQLVRSQLAAGLDVLFVSDHDSTANHEALRRLAAARGVPFLPGIELSPSWGHFNAYPLPRGAQPAIDMSTASVSEVLREARRMGASIVQVNHPFIPFGYFSSVAKGVAPGGFDPGFDLVEVNSSVPKDDAQVLQRVWGYWNEGKHYYLSAGSDTHDVWNEVSGRVRTYVYVPGALTAETFADNLKQGHAYVTYGPLIFPAVSFGTQLQAAPGEALALAFRVASVAKLRQVQLIGDGEVRETRDFPQAPLSAELRFTRTAAPDRWYALVVEDQAGRRAYSDPIWIGPAGAPKESSSR